MVVARAPPLEQQHQSLASLEQDQHLQKHEKQPSSASVTAQPQEPNATDMVSCIRLAFREVKGRLRERKGKRKRGMGKEGGRRGGKKSLSMGELM